jgi:hypothetical protein
LEGGTLEVQEEDGHTNSFSLGTGHELIVETAEQEKE